MTNQADTAVETPFDEYLTHVKECEDYCDTCEDFEGVVWSHNDNVWSADIDDPFAEWALHATMPEMLTEAQKRWRAAFAEAS